MRRLKFQQITDSRFEHEDRLLDILQGRMEAIETSLSAYPEVNVMRGEPYRLSWPDDGTIQYRVTYYIEKNTKSVTWNQIMGIVNSVKAVPYDWI